MDSIKKLEDIKKIEISEESKRLFSANHEDIYAGLTTDVYFVRTLDILREMELDDCIVTAEIFARKKGIFVGINEVYEILKGQDIEVWSVDEGYEFNVKETLVRIRGKYSQFAIFESVILGCLASPSGWATAASEVKSACGDSTFTVFGTRHLHPAVSPVMERAAYIGGASAVSNILAGKKLGVEPMGTLPHAAFLIAGDTVRVAKIYDQIMPPSHKRIVLIDTFKDEVEEALRVADALGENLYAVRLDTPSERGGVSPALVNEVRQHLDLKGYHWVKIFVSGGLNPDKIKALKEAGADSFGVGSYISGASAIDMTMDIKEVNDKPVAKRGRLPGRVENENLKRII
ncbi:MAG: nicotinate phosphoribosyltransferase [Tissierellales bacterium]|nr:nicotinate phosphoribosyltransferase [Tissierellales bacterium]MBN2828136.1 nicotinate phosphoribosyltransferase [Tissierellales bacterium]